MTETVNQSLTAGHGPVAGAVAFAGAQGNFELNAMRPIIINNTLHAIRVLGDACEKFRTYS
ncbi:hypothetical protein CTI14_59290, partial [Methylobacterium radiotolerans]